jgi:hypothetical protein
MTGQLAREDRVIKNAEEVVELLAGQIETGADIPKDILVNALRWMIDDYRQQVREERALFQIASAINQGLLLEDVLDKAYESLRGIIPYDRIGFSLIEDDGAAVQACWARSDDSPILLAKGYRQPLAGSSLLRILETGQPRILNDLEAYLRAKPESQSTQLIVEEGLRSSLTCPLIAEGRSLGFIFFSSREPGAYSDAHSGFFQRIAVQLSVIVEKAHLMSELEERNRALAETSEAKSRLLGVAAHDLRNPIANIQMAARLLHTGDVDLDEEESKVFLASIGEQSEYMLNLIDDLLDVSQIESGELLLDLAEIELDRFLRETVGWHGRLAKDKGTRIELHRVAEGRVQADPVRLRQIMDNLLSNAIKYSPPGSVIQVEARRVDRFYLIRVIDQGPGIAEDDRERVFTYFGRLGVRTTGGERSTGLGLAITRQAVRAHGGEIGVENAEGGGSVFWFTLPAAA